MKRFIAILLISILLLSVTAFATEEKTTFSADDSRVNYVGRWIKNEKGYMEGSFECSVVVRFTGTSLYVTKSSRNNVYVSVDGGEPVLKSLGTKNLCSGLEDGEHVALITAYAQKAFPVISGFEVDKGATLLEAEKKPVIEFIGDSIMEGYVVGNNSVTNSYGYKTARLLNYDCNIVAFGGITMQPNEGTPDKQGMYNRYFMRKEYSPEEPVSEAWDTSLFVPDMIVINLGTNGASSLAANFKMYYSTFLQKLRTAYPDTAIAIMTPFNGKRSTEITEIYDASTDPNLHLIQSHLWNIPGGSDNLHPDVEGHEMAAEKLKAAILEINEKLSATPTPETPAPATDSTIQENGSSQEDGQNSFNPIFLVPIGAALLIIGATVVILLVKKGKKK